MLALLARGADRRLWGSRTHRVRAHVSRAPRSACSVGDLIYTWLALRLARRTGRADVTAMPFGLDTPSTIGMGLLVLGPAFAKFRAAGLDPTAAGLETWYLGMAATATMGVVKLLLSFAGRGRAALDPNRGTAGLSGGHRIDADRLLSHGRFAADPDRRLS